MTQTQGKYLVAHDKQTEAFIIRTTDGSSPVPAEEVIQPCDGSAGVKPRTGRRIDRIVQQQRDEEVTLRVLLKPGPWTGFEHLDLLDVLACA